MRANTRNVQQGEQEIRGVGEGRTKQWGEQRREEICGRKRNGAGYMGKKMMDTTRTFRTLHDRELSGRKVGNLKEVGLGWINWGRKDHGFWLVEEKGWW